MKKVQLVYLLLTLCLLSCNNTETQLDIGIEEQKIRDLFQNWVHEVSKSMDSDTYFKFVTDDFVLSESNSPAITDRNELKLNVKTFLGNFNQIRLENWKSDEIIIRDDIAIHRHSGVLILLPKADSTEMEVSLKYVDILKKNDIGEWKVYIHSNMPNK